MAASKFQIVRKCQVCGEEFMAKVLAYMRIHRTVIDLILLAYLSNSIAVLRFKTIKFLHLFRFFRSLGTKRIEFHKFLFAHSYLVSTEIDVRNLPFAYKPVKSKTTDTKQGVCLRYLDEVLLLWNGFDHLVKKFVSFLLVMPTLPCCLGTFGRTIPGLYGLIPTRQIGNYVYVPKKEIDNLYKGAKQ